MKLAPIAVVIALFGAIAGSVFLALSNDGRVANSDQSGESANAPGMTAAPTVVGWQFKQDDVACIHLTDAEHLLQLARDHDSTAYQNYADQNECYGMHQGTPVYRESGSYDYDQVVEIRKKGSANSLYTLRGNLDTVTAVDSDKLIEQAEQDGNVAPPSLQM